MNIIWQYLDKRSAAIAALKDYSSMVYIIENTDSEIAKLHDDKYAWADFLSQPIIHSAHSASDDKSPAVTVISDYY